MAATTEPGLEQDNDAALASTEEIAERAEAVTRDKSFGRRASEAGYAVEIERIETVEQVVQLPGALLIGLNDGPPPETTNSLVPRLERTVVVYAYSDGVRCWIDAANLLTPELANLHLDSLIEALESQPVTQDGVSVWPVEPIEMGDRSFTVDRLRIREQAGDLPILTWERSQTVIVGGTLHNIGCSIPIEATTDVGTPPSELNPGTMLDVFKYFVDEYEYRVFDGGT